MTDFELLLQELRELRLAVAELNDKTDKVIGEVAGLTLRVDTIKLEKLEITGIEVKIGGGNSKCL